ncbi:MAG: hypothetical protein E7565_07835 [Ruminococcaceae bacterium]|nr:hypothetical protein [Oscillospiraceae bacterium]
MNYEQLKNTLYDYYFEKLPDMVEELRVKVFGIMDEYAENHKDATSYQLKAKFYEVIADNFTPVIFDDIPFAFETGALLAWCDGRYDRGGEHANGWLIRRNEHLYEEYDPENYKKYKTIGGLYSQCGIFADFMHMGIPMKKVFSVGLSGVLDELSEAKKTCANDQETDFINCAEAGIKALHKIALRLADKAREKGNFELAEITERVPFNPPKTFHEGLCTMGFMRKALGTIEGYGFSSMGRADVLLKDLYEKDKANGVSEEEMLDLVSRFLIFFDATNDRREKFDGVVSYELENTLTLGGCDENGEPVYNGVTKLFIDARDTLNCTYPKFMCRFSENSPEEYLRLISRSLTKGQSYSIYENDDTMIPALLRCGTELKDARNYIVGGCWDALTPDYNNKYSGECFFLVHPLLWLMKKESEKLVNLGVEFKSFLEAETFDELYESYISVVGQIVQNRISYSTRGSQVWDKVNPACALSALMEPCIKMKKDMTAGGIKYGREAVYFTCFAEVCDSLFVIKKLCFDEKVFTMKELFDQCFKNWENEELRQKVLKVASFGDGSEEVTAFAGRFFDDLCKIGDNIENIIVGKCRVGFNLYTEIVRSGQWLNALPNGFKTGDFLSQGITPTRNGNKDSLYNMLDSFKNIDFKKTSGNASMTVTLPAGKINEEAMASLLRVFARNGLQAIQPNVINRDELIKAKAEPEKYGDIIVRVCGFSAPFVLLPEKYQDEIISRSLLEV